MTSKVVVAGRRDDPVHQAGQERGLRRDGRRGRRARALADAGVGYADVQQAYAGYVYGDSTCGQRRSTSLGLTGIPVFNVNNNCSTGSSALLLARQAVDGGTAECVLALGFEQMEPGALGSKFDRPHEPARRASTRSATRCRASTERAARRADVRRRRARIRGSTARTGDVRARSPRRRASTRRTTRTRCSTTCSRSRSPGLPDVFDPLTRYQCCPPTCGAAAAVLCSRRVREEARHRSRVVIAAQAMTTDYADHVRERDMIKMVGYDMARGRRAAGLRAGRPRPRGRRRRRAPRLLHRQRAAHLRGARPLQGGRRREVHLGRRQHLRRQVRHQPVGRPALQGPPARRDRPRAVHRARLAAPRPGREAPGRRREVALQHNLGLGGACVVTMYQKVDG